MPVIWGVDEGNQRRTKEGAAMRRLIILGVFTILVIIGVACTQTEPTIIQAPESTVSAVNTPTAAPSANACEGKMPSVIHTRCGALGTQSLQTIICQLFHFRRTPGYV